VEAGLALLVILDARFASGLVGVGAGLAVVLLALSLASDLEAALHASLAVLALLLLARANERLILAPLYGAALLAVSELARTSRELRYLQWVDPAVIAARVATAVASASLGGCAAALVAVAAAGGLARSVGLSVGAILAVGLAYAGIVAAARRGQPVAADLGRRQHRQPAPIRR
jgi:hypothetical protein